MSSPVFTVASFSTVAFSACLSLTGCVSATDDSTAEPGPATKTEVVVVGDEDVGDTLLQSYSVADEQAHDLAEAISRVLRTKGEQPSKGRVEIMPGRLVVLAPRGVHAGIEQLIADLERTESVGLAPTISISYWFVVGERAAESNASSLAELGPALEQIAAAQGPMRFTVTERAEMSSLLDRRAQARGRATRIEQVVTRAAGRLVADLEMNVEGGTKRGSELETRVALEPGKLAVIGQNGWSGADEQTLFYVIRAEVESGAG